MFIISEYEDITYGRGSREMPWNPPFRMKVYYYLVSGLLIDTGPSSLADEAVEFFNINTIEQVFLTHIHEDHAGMAYWLKDNKHIPIYLHPGSVEEAMEEPELAEYRLQIWGRRQAFAAEPAPESINAGSYVFDVIDSPGHCRHHMVLHEKSKGWLFAGDLIPNLKPTCVFGEENLSEMITSLKRILKLDFSTVFCPHTGVRKNGKELFATKLKYLLELQQTIKGLREKGFTDSDINQCLFPGPDTIEKITAGEISSYYIVSTL